jgi:hypothetical protein
MTPAIRDAGALAGPAYRAFVGQRRVLGLFADEQSARAAEGKLRGACPDWWVTAAPIARS